MKVLEVSPLDGFKLSLRFENGEEGIADLSDLAGRGVLSAWNERSVFERAQVTELGAVEWPGDIDICGDSLYLRATGKQPEQLFPNLAVASKASLVLDPTSPYEER